MPHLILEYSANILEKEQLHMLLTQCNLMLVELLSTQIQNCRSRAYEATNFEVANNPNQAFVHVTLKILTGRKPAVIEDTGQKLLLLFQEFFKSSLEKLKLKLSLEIVELASYFF